MTRSRGLWSILACMAVLVCGSSSVYAQLPGPDTTPVVAPQPGIWANFGLGADLEGEYIGLGASVSREIARGRMISGRAIYLEEFQLCIFGPCTTDPDHRIDLGVLYGLVERSNRWIVSAGAGLGVVSGTRIVEYVNRAQEKTYISPSIPLEANMSLRLFSSVGIGAYGFASLNRKQSLTGLLLVLQFRNYD